MSFDDCDTRTLQNIEARLADIVENRTSLRDQFAMAVLTGMLSDPNEAPDENESMTVYRKEMAEASYRYADAMLKAREVK